MIQYPIEQLNNPYFDKLRGDILFKSVMFDDRENYYVLKDIIKAFTDKTVSEITILKTEETPNSHNDKTMILDVLVKDEKGNYFNFEMQNSKMTKEEILRFQCYGSTLVSRQPKKGFSYAQTVHEVYQVILIDDALDNELVSEFEMRKKDGTPLVYGLLHMIIVNLPNIKFINKEKSEMSAKEQYAYTFKNGFDDAILKVNKGVRLMQEKAKYFYDEELLKIWKFNAEWAKQNREIERQRELEKVREQSLQEGIQKGSQDTEFKTNVQSCINLMDSLQKNLEEVMDLLKFDDLTKTKIRIFLNK